MTKTARIELPPKLIPLFSKPRGYYRYRVAYGGRGSGKSFTFALMAAVWGYVEPLRILCTREMQNSIKESFHAEIKNAIQSIPWLEESYDVGVDYIRGKNGTEFIFRGLRHNMSSIKSMAQIDLCIVEEASDVPAASWESLLPTIRAPKSEFWIVYNPRKPTDPVDVMFRGSEPPPRSMVIEQSWKDNPWFPPELEEQRIHAQKIMDDALYRHIWEGEYYEQSDAQVLKGKYRVDEFEANSTWQGPYYGLDHGFSVDPMAALRCWIHDDRIWVDYEAGKVGLELDATADHVIRHVPGIAEHVIRADNARPEANSYLRRHGLPKITAVEKGKGSVEDGIQFIRSFREVVIHPRCKNVISEARLYSYKTDRLSGDVMPDLVDANNHWIDALRYALEPIMKRRDMPMVQFKM